MHRVVFQQIREGLGVRQIIDRDELQDCWSPREARSTLRPIRPNPLMPIL